MESLLDLLDKPYKTEDFYNGKFNFDKVYDIEYRVIKTPQGSNVVIDKISCENSELSETISITFSKGIEKLLQAMYNDVNNKPNN